jgi:hypothetical protein
MGPQPQTQAMTPAVLTEEAQAADKQVVEEVQRQTLMQTQQNFQSIGPQVDFGDLTAVMGTLRVGADFDLWTLIPGDTAGGEIDFEKLKQDAQNDPKVQLVLEGFANPSALQKSIDQTAEQATGAGLGTSKEEAKQGVISSLWGLAKTGAAMLTGAAKSAATKVAKFLGISTIVGVLFSAGVMAASYMPASMVPGSLAGKAGAIIEAGSTLLSTAGAFVAPGSVLYNAAMAVSSAASTAASGASAALAPVYAPFTTLVNGAMGVVAGSLLAQIFLGTATGAGLLYLSWKIFKRFFDKHATSAGIELLEAATALKIMQDTNDKLKSSGVKVEVSADGAGALTAQFVALTGPELTAAADIAKETGLNLSQEVAQVMANFFNKLVADGTIKLVAMRKKIVDNTAETQSMFAEAQSQSARGGRYGRQGTFGGRYLVRQPIDFSAAKQLFNAQAAAIEKVQERVHAAGGRHRTLYSSGGRARVASAGGSRRHAASGGTCSYSW